MKKRIFSAILAISLSLIILITAIVTGTYYSSYRDSRVKLLQEESQLVIRGLELNGDSFFDDVKFDEYRVTWIKDDGTVLYDSSRNLEELENHLEREEVEEALSKGYGESIRFSDTILEESFYVAYKITDGTIVRLSCTQSSVISLAISALFPMYFVAFLAFVVSILVAYLISKSIIGPLDKMNLDNLSEIKTYPELEPFVKRINQQKNQLLNDKKEIEKMSQVRQDFTANVTHEMKTPLHVIAGYSELMKEGLAKEEDVKDFSSKIYLESYRLTKLVDDILQLSKLDNGLPDGEMKSISLNSIAKNAIDSLQTLADKKHITIKAKLRKTEIKGISDVVYGMIHNLIDNAIKYNKENGEIRITVEKAGPRPTFVISDTGIGIPDEDLDRIFERFYRVDKSHSREIGGTGLGLSIVKHAAIIHNAKVEVESVLGEGTTFKITF